MTYHPTEKQHFWTAVCDEKGNQIGDLIHCDRCKKTFHSGQLNPGTDTVRKGEKPVRVDK